MDFNPFFFLRFILGIFRDQQEEIRQKNQANKKI